MFFVSTVLVMVGNFGNILAWLGWFNFMPV